MDGLLAPFGGSEQTTHDASEPYQGQPVVSREHEVAGDDQHCAEDQKGQHQNRNPGRALSHGLRNRWGVTP